MRLTRPTFSPATFAVWLARITALRKPRLIQATNRGVSGRSTSQNRMRRVTSEAFSALWMNVSSKSTASPSRQWYGSPSTTMAQLAAFGVASPR